MSLGVKKIKIGEYMAKLLAKTRLSHAHSSSFNSLLAKRAKWWWWRNADVTQTWWRHRRARREAGAAKQNGDCSGPPATSMTSPWRHRRWRSRSSAVHFRLHAPRTVIQSKHWTRLGPLCFAFYVRFICVQLFQTFSHRCAHRVGQKNGATDSWPYFCQILTDLQFFHCNNVAYRLRMWAFFHRKKCPKWFGKRPHRRRTPRA